MTNYRPIALLPVFGKVFEKTMHSVLSHNLHTNNILITEQYDCRKGIATENPTFKLRERVFKYISSKMHTGEICCDLVKVFECGNHEFFS